MGLGLGGAFKLTMFNVSTKRSAVYCRLCVLLSCYRQRTNKFLKMEVHWQTCSHCLFLLCFMEERHECFVLA